ncbi:hypothetical protein OROGR_002413 [Orobanche gracilis]
MGWYRRSSRFIVDALHCYNSKAAFPLRSNSTGLRIFQYSQPVLRNSFLQNVIKNNLRNKPPFRLTIAQYSQPILRNSILHNLFKNNLGNNHPFANGSKRFYFEFADKNKVHYFRNKRWSQNSRIVITISLLVSGVFIPVYFWNLETVPYTERTHFVLLSSYLEKEVGGILFDFLKTDGYEGKILPSHHPKSIRVQKIGQDIIGALLKGLRKDEQSMKKMGVKSQTAHVEEFKWEIIVVDDTSIDNAYCFPGGKIVIFTGMLNHLKSDAEIATIIGHEVGHAVARHSAEQMSGILWLLLLQFFMPDVLKMASNLFLRLPFSRRNEMEADYIGLLLMASAGYDPRVAPQVYYTFEDRSRSLWDDYLSTHPHGKRRAQLLSEPKVMEEALSVYKEALKEGEDGRPMDFFNRFIG